MPRQIRGLPLTRADWIAIVIAAVSLVGGIVVLAASADFFASIAGACLVGLAGIACVALAFLLVGESEDREYSEGRRR